MTPNMSVHHFPDLDLELVFVLLIFYFSFNRRFRLEP